MFRKMYQGGSSRKQALRLAIHEPDLEPPREAQVRPCEWPSDEFMVHAGFKDEFDAYVQNAGPEDFMSALVHVGAIQTAFNPFPRWCSEPSPSECGR